MPISIVIFLTVCSTMMPLNIIFFDRTKTAKIQFSLKNTVSRKKVKIFYFLISNSYNVFLGAHEKKY